MNFGMIMLAFFLIFLGIHFLTALPAVLVAVLAFVTAVLLLIGK